MYQRFILQEQAFGYFPLERSSSAKLHFREMEINTNPYANAVKVKHNIVYGALVYQFYGYHFPYICWAMFGGLWPNKLYLDLGFILFIIMLQ